MYCFLDTFQIRAQSIDNENFITHFFNFVHCHKSTWLWMSTRKIIFIFSVSVSFWKILFSWCLQKSSKNKNQRIHLSRPMRILLNMVAQELLQQRSKFDPVQLPRNRGHQWRRNVSWLSRKWTSAGTMQGFFYNRE